jgi:hypothetical protein
MREAMVLHIYRRQSFPAPHQISKEKSRNRPTLQGVLMLIDVDCLIMPDWQIDIFWCLANVPYIYETWALLDILRFDLS